jgi:hypothetical protein
MTRAKLLLQDGEADALERVLDLLLTDQKYADIFQSGEERRCIRRVSKKIFWTKAEQCKAA